MKYFNGVAQDSTARHKIPLSSDRGVTWWHEAGHPMEKPKTNILSTELRASRGVAGDGVSEGIRTLVLQGHNLAP